MGPYKLCNNFSYLQAVVHVMHAYSVIFYASGNKRNRVFFAVILTNP